MRPYVPRGWTRRFLGVAEGPGEHEDETSGQPLTGAAGQLLCGLIKEAGHSPTDWAFTNAVLCRPPKNATPRMAQVRACRPFLLSIIETLRPDFVVGFGDTALRALLNQGTLMVTRFRGRLQTIPDLTVSPRCWVTYHPAACLYPGGSANRFSILRDLRRSWEWLPEPADRLPGEDTPAAAVDTEYAADGRVLCVAWASRETSRVADIGPTACG